MLPKILSKITRIQVYRMLFRDKLLDAFCSVSIPANIFIGSRYMKSQRSIEKIGVLVYSYKKIGAQNQIIQMTQSGELQIFSEKGSSIFSWSDQKGLKSDDKQPQKYSIECHSDQPDHQRVHNFVRHRNYNTKNYHSILLYIQNEERLQIRENHWNPSLGINISNEQDLEKLKELIIYSKHCRFKFRRTLPQSNVSHQQQKQHCRKQYFLFISKESRKISSILADLFQSQNNLRDDIQNCSISIKCAEKGRVQKSFESIMNQVAQPFQTIIPSSEKQLDEYSLSQFFSQIPKLTELSIIELKKIGNSLKQKLTNILKFKQLFSYFEVNIIKFIRAFQLKAYKKQQLFQFACQGITHLMGQLRKQYNIEDIYQHYQKYHAAVIEPSSRTMILNSSFEEFSRIYRSIYKLRDLNQKEGIQLQILFIFLDRLKTGEERTQKNDTKIRCNGNRAQTLGSFIPQIVQLHSQTSSKVLDIFSQVQYKYQPTKRIRNNRLQKQKDQFLDNLEMEMLIENRCLGCSQFFYEKSNIYDPSVVVTPLEVFPTEQIINLNQETAKKVRNVICAFMNSGGGVIMFGVKRVDISYLAIGMKLDSIQQNQMTVYFQRIIQHIMPANRISESVKLDFIPLVKNPMLEVMNRQEITHQFNSTTTKKIQRAPIDNTFIVRIRVCPLNSTKLSFVEKQQKLECYVWERSKATKLMTREITKYMKKQFKIFYTSTQMNQQFRRLASKPQNCFGHQCDSVETFVRENLQFIKYKKFIRLQQKYRHMYLVAAHISYLQIVKEKMQDASHPCSLETGKFPHLNFENEKKYIILYTDLDYSVVKERLRQLFPLRNRLVTEVIKTVKIYSYTSSQQYNPYRQEFVTYAQWIVKQFTTEEVKLFSYLSEKFNKPFTEYYFVLESKTSAYLTFMLINYFRTDRATFQCPELAKLTENEKAQKMKMVHKIAIADYI